MPRKSTHKRTSVSAALSLTRLGCRPCCPGPLKGAMQRVFAADL